MEENGKNTIKWKESAISKMEKNEKIFIFLQVVKSDMMTNTGRELNKPRFF